ncbi:MAG: MFS transporter [Candidatus Paracaedibacteraceae bacterium]|nr:MFS transporter [Candidatus Paracaedibacteraceae bacterium]
MKNNEKKIKTPIPLSIWAIGLASCLLNMTSALVFSLSAIYLNGQGVGIQWISTLEHIVEGIAYIMKVFSGIISDYFRRRKMIMVIGFGMAAFSRPILAFSVSFFAVGMAYTIIFVSRVFERIGNGMQATPRDALVADLSPYDIKGECFGLRTALSNAGSFIGAGLGVLAMWWTANNYQQIFWMACIPAILALIILVVLVKDSKLKPEEMENQETPKKHPLHFTDMNRLGKPFWYLMIVVTVFMLARVSESLLSLHAHKNFEMPEQWVPMVVLIYNAANSLTAYPIGRFSDRIPRHYILAIGCLCLVIADALLAFAPNLTVALIGVGVWGIQVGITQSMFLALIADYVPADLRGTGFGIFYLFSAGSIVLAGVFGGMIADIFSISIMYIASGCIASVSLGLLFVISKLGKMKQKVA